MYGNDLNTAKAAKVQSGITYASPQRGPIPTPTREGGLMDTIAAQERLLDQLQETLRQLHADLGHLLRPMPEPGLQEAQGPGYGSMPSVATEKVATNNHRIIALIAHVNSMREGADL